MAVYTRYWTWLSWFALIVLSVGLYTVYVWVANLFDVFQVYQTIQVVFRTPQFYLATALNFGCVLLAEAMYVYVKKEYFTQTSDFLRDLSKRGKADDPKKLQKVESVIVTKRNKSIESFTIGGDFEK